MKKKTGIIIGCAVLALVIAAAAFFGIRITDLERQNAYIDQVNELAETVDTEYISEIDRDAFNTIIDSRVCKGKYAKLENAVKSYYKAIYEIQFQSEDALQNSSYDQMLMPENLKADGPEFEKSRAELAQLSETVDSCISQYNELTAEEKAKQYFAETGLSKKYESLFNDAVSITSGTSENAYIESLEALKKTITAISAVLDYLTETKNQWSVDGEKIVFNNKDAADKYGEYIAALEAAQANQ